MHSNLGLSRHSILTPSGQHLAHIDNQPAFPRWTQTPHNETLHLRLFKRYKVFPTFELEVKTIYFRLVFHGLTLLVPYQHILKSSVHHSFSKCLSAMSPATRESTVSYLLNMPDEVLHHTLTEVNPQDLGRLSQCCQRLYTFIGTNQLLFKEIYLKNWVSLGLTWI